MRLQSGPVFITLCSAFLWNTVRGGSTTSCPSIPEISDSECPNPGIVYVPSPKNAAQYGYLPANTTQYNLPWSEKISTIERAMSSYAICHLTADIVSRYELAWGLYGNMTGQVAADAWNCVLGVGQPKDSEVVSRLSTTATETATATFTFGATSTTETTIFTVTYTSSDFSATATQTLALSSSTSSMSITAAASSASGTAASAGVSVKHGSQGHWALVVIFLTSFLVGHYQAL